MTAVELVVKCGWKPWKHSGDRRCLQVCPHLYAIANEAYGTEANPNECQKVVCLAFAWLNIHPALRTYFSFKY